MLALALAALLAASLQDTVDRAMAGHPGVAAVLDLHSGRLLALSQAATAARRPVKPGSTIKPFVLAALLESGRFDPARRVFCPTRLRLGAHRMDCVHPAVPEGFTASTALAYSCNYYFAQAARALSVEELSAALRRYGFTVQTPEDPALLALGESGVLITPLDLLAAYRRLALRRPEAKLAPLFQGLLDCTTFGTGRLAAPVGLAVAGKTGSSGHAWFIGWPTGRRPANVVLVFLERGSGGSDAAPIARQIFAPDSAPGTLTLRLNQSRTLSLNLEDYVAGVLLGECPTFRSPESVKAMAVAARTFAARFRGRHRAEGFDFCDTTHCQYYRAGPIPPRLRDAVEATQGELLWYQGSPAAAYYHQDCGGSTEAAQFVWPDLSAPYLRQQGDAWCVSHGRMEWRAEIRREELARLLGAPVDSLVILDRTPSGRVARLRVSHRTFSATAFHLAVGRALGWNRLRSANYEVHDAGDRFLFHGYGSGHGVGLCQAGAERMGGAGKSYREILDYYYPGTRAGLSAQGIAWRRLASERLELWTTRPAEDQSLIPLAERLLRDAERRTGFPARVLPQLRVYPTLALFRDSTGEPGTVAASTRGRVIRLQPPAVLRSRGVLESTLLHELLHVLIETRARSGLPLWFREGLVVYLTGGAGRVTSLAATHGRAAVLSWVEAGLPPSL